MSQEFLILKQYIDFFKLAIRQTDSKERKDIVKNVTIKRIEDIETSEIFPSMTVHNGNVDL